MSPSRCSLILALLLGQLRLPVLRNSVPAGKSLSQGALTLSGTVCPAFRPCHGSRYTRCSLSPDLRALSPDLHGSALDLQTPDAGECGWNIVLVRHLGHRFAALLMTPFVGGVWASSQCLIALKTAHVSLFSRDTKFRQKDNGS